MFTNPSSIVPEFHIKPGMKIVDFGSGSGTYAVEFAHAVGPDGHIYAVDIQKELLDSVVREAEKAGYKNITPIWADLEKVEATKLGSNSIDFVLISNLLFQMKGKKALFIEAARILKPYGRVVVIDWTDSFGGMGPQRSALVTREEVIQIAKEARLAFGEEFDPGDHHYGLIFNKAIE